MAGFVAQDSSESAITYVEYSYGRNSSFPAVKMPNAANYYVEPTATSVAVALLKAKINPSDLTADLSQVYVDTDPRTYPLSSYSYMVIPKDTTANINTEKGRTLSEFAAYFLCEGSSRPMRWATRSYRSTWCRPGSIGSTRSLSRPRNSTATT